MYTLGINAVFHDSSAALVKDGELVAAAEEERFTHRKHAKRPIPFSTYELPYHAVDYCLREAGIRLADVDHVAYSFNPFELLNGHGNDGRISLPLKPSDQPANGWLNPWDPLFLSLVVNAPRQLADGAPHHLKAAFEGARHDGPYRWHFVDHHIAHAASAFHASPFEESAVMTLDGRGEKDTTSYSLGTGTGLERLGAVRLPNSLGLLYEAVTTHLGFLHSSDEYKVMALASFGRPTFLKAFRDIVKLGEGGQYTVAPADLEAVFGPRRSRGGPYERRHFDIAHSLQAVLEETVLELAHWLHRETRADSLCMAGGVALNCVLNARLRDRGPFKTIWVQPAAGDAGTSLGAALWIDAKERGDRQRRYVMKHPYLGPAFGDDEIEALLRWTKAPYRKVADVAKEAAALLAEDRVIGWFQGRMEFGPRALGARSILASPISPGMQAKLNEIKDREDFRPVAPVVLEEEAGNWFNGAGESPFMLFVFDVRPDRADRIPAVRHIDGTARIQTVRRDQNPPYYDVIKAFQGLTGVPVLVNTSFNTRGEPIVCTPRDALECFWTSPLDALAIGSFIVEKAARD